MKFGRKIFFTGGLYNSPGTFVGLIRDLPDSFYEILVIIFRLVVLMFFGIFCAKMMKFGWEMFLTWGIYNLPGTLAGLFQHLLESFHTECFDS